MKLRRFSKGGVHPPENKLSATSSVKVFPVPEKVTIQLAQHIGAPAKPVVAKGDKVKVGTLLGEPAGFISAAVHSSVSGTVTAIEETANHMGKKVPSITIKVEGDEWEESIDRSDDIKKDCELCASEIVDIMKNLGIVGMGGATFPAHVKYMFPPDKKADALIINGVECEPYLTSDHRLMLEKPIQILVGVSIMMKAAKVERAFVGIEANKPDAIELLEKESKSFTGIEIVPLKVQYPQGAEKQLIKAILDREVPSGKLPLDVGCVVNNVATAFAVYEAVQKRKPLFERIITVTGSKVKTPCNYIARVGTPVADIIKAAEGDIETSGKIIAGGPMMGHAVSNTGFFMTKGSSGVILMSEDEAKRSEPQNCIRCAKCVSVCPMGLQPYLLEKLSEKDRFEDAEKEFVTDCIECGSCSFTCPSARPLLDYIRYGKANVMRIMRERRAKQ